MYMRLLQMKVKPEHLMELRRQYDDIILPAFMKIEGCQYACLIQADQREDECVSMTLWDTQAHAEEYERSGLFRKLVGVLQPYLADSSEWKVQLSSDLTLEYAPVPEEPVVKSYSVAASSQEKLAPEGVPERMYVRLFSPKIQPGKMEEFRNLYVQLVIPALRNVKGCRYAYLTQSVSEENECISITIWDSKEDAENYENSVLFKELLKKVRHTFSELYQWKMGLEKESGKQAVTSEDLVVSAYSVVTGKTFH